MKELKKPLGVGVWDFKKKMAGADPTFLKPRSRLGIAQHGVEKITVYRLPLHVQDLLIDTAPCDTVARTATCACVCVTRRKRCADTYLSGGAQAVLHSRRRLRRAETALVGAGSARRRAMIATR